MALTLSTTIGNSALDDILDSVTHFSLHTSDPGANGANEASGNGYARKASACDSASSKASANTSEMVWTASGGTLGGAAVTHFGMWDALSGGNFIGGGSLSASRTVADAETLTIAAGDIDVTI